jgi:hypothetical protein
VSWCSGELVQIGADNNATVRTFWEGAAASLGLDAGFVDEAAARAGGKVQHAVQLRSTWLWIRRSLDHEAHKGRRQPSGATSMPMHRLAPRCLRDKRRVGILGRFKCHMLH